MTRWGTRLSRTLYGLLLFLLVLTALAALAAVASILWTWLHPQTLWESPLHVHYAHAEIFWPNTAEARLAISLVGLMLCATVALGLVPLLQVARTAMTGDPFVRANIARLRIIASAFLIIALGRLLLPLMLPSPASDLFQVQPTDARLDAGPLFAALVIFVLAEVFREGVRLRDDVDATI